MARPKKQIDQSSFEGLCAIQCTKEEICAFLGITDKTLDRWCREVYKRHFSEVFAEKRGLGKISLRRNQWRLAEKNTAMAIFLGKQYLGQREVMEYEDKEGLARLDAILQGMRTNATKSEAE